MKQTKVTSKFTLVLIAILVVVFASAFGATLFGDSINGVDSSLNVADATVTDKEYYYIDDSTDTITLKTDSLTSTAFALTPLWNPKDTAQSYWNMSSTTYSKGTWDSSSDGTDNGFGVEFAANGSSMFGYSNVYATQTIHINIPDYIVVKKIVCSARLYAYSACTSTSASPSAINKTKTTLSLYNKSDYVEKTSKGRPINGYRDTYETKTLTIEKDLTNTTIDLILTSNCERSGNSTKYGSNHYSQVKDITFTITGELKSYNISYCYDEGSVATDNPTSYNYCTSSFTLNNPTKDNYTFIGWTGSNGDTPQKTVSIPSGSYGDRNYKANWEPNYRIIYHYGDNSDVNSYEKTGTYNLKTIDTLGWSKDYYSFSGWATTSGGSVKYEDGESYQILILGETLNLYAVWTPINYTITIEPNKGTYPESTTKTYNIETTTFSLSTPTRDYYDFTGWTGTNGSTPQKTITISKGSYGNKTYTANWKAIEYSITYEDGGDHSLTPTTYTVETPTITLPTPTKKGYVFSSWSPSGQITQGSTGNKTFTAEWTEVKFTITYAKNDITVEGGNVPENQKNLTVTSTGSLKNCTIKKQDNFFMKWTDGTKEYAENATINSGIKLTDYQSNWTDTSFTITLKPVWTGELEFGRDADKTGQWGSEKNPYLIKTITHLNNLRDIVNGGTTSSNSDGRGSIVGSKYSTYTNPNAEKNKQYANCYFTLSNDINYGNLDEQYRYVNPIGTATYPFKGIFNGNSKKISGLLIRMSSPTDGVGLFGTIDSATIQYLTVSISITLISGQTSTGCVVGNAKNNSTIENCSNNGSSFTSDTYNSSHVDIDYSIISYDYTQDADNSIWNIKDNKTNTKVYSKNSGSTEAKRNNLCIIVDLGGLFKLTGFAFTSADDANKFSDTRTIQKIIIRGFANHPGYYYKGTTGNGEPGNNMLNEGVQLYNNDNANMVTTNSTRKDYSISSTDYYQYLLVYVTGIKGTDCGVAFSEFDVYGENPQKVGGIVGNLTNSSVLNSNNEININTKLQYVGGIVGYSNTSQITSCNNGNIIFAQCAVGGITGCIINGAIAKCVNTGNITANGGASTVNSVNGAHLGGIAGYSSAHIKQCYNSGNISTVSAWGSSNFVGGIAGYNANLVSYSYSQGTIEGSSGVGGIVGQNSSGDGKGVNYVYFDGTIHGVWSNENAQVGYIAGIDGKISNSWILNHATSTSNGPVSYKSIGYKLTTTETVKAAVINGSSIESNETWLKLIPTAEVNGFIVSFSITNAQYGRSTINSSTGSTVVTPNIITSNGTLSTEANINSTTSFNLVYAYISTTASNIYVAKENIVYSSTDATYSANYQQAIRVDTPSQNQYSKNIFYFKNTNYNTSNYLGKSLKNAGSYGAMIDIVLSNKLVGRYNLSDVVKINPKSLTVKMCNISGGQFSGATVTRDYTYNGFALGVNTIHFEGFVSGENVENTISDSEATLDIKISLSNLSIKSKDDNVVTLTQSINAMHAGSDTGIDEQYAYIVKVETETNSNYSISSDNTYQVSWDIHPVIVGLNFESIDDITYDGLYHKLNIPTVGRSNFVGGKNNQMQQEGQDIFDKYNFVINGDEITVTLPTIYGDGATKTETITINLTSYNQVGTYTYKLNSGITFTRNSVPASNYAISTNDATMTILTRVITISKVEWTDGKCTGDNDRTNNQDEYFKYNKAQQGIKTLTYTNDLASLVGTAIATTGNRQETNVDSYTYTVSIDSDILKSTYDSTKYNCIFNDNRESVSYKYIIDAISISDKNVYISYTGLVSNSALSTYGTGYDLNANSLVYSKKNYDTAHLELWCKLQSDFDEVTYSGDLPTLKMSEHVKSCSFTITGTGNYKGTRTIQYKLMDGDYGQSSTGTWGSSTNPYVISAVEHLTRLSEIVNGTSEPWNSVNGYGDVSNTNTKNKDITYSGCYFVVVNNIEIPSTLGFAPIGKDGTNYFAADFNGQSKSITVSISKSSDYTGLFGYINGSFIHDLTIKGSVSGTNYVGGLVGKTDASKLASITNEANIIGSGEKVGGIVGCFYGVFEEDTTIINKGNVESSSDYVGGIAGQSFATCKNVKFVSGKQTDKDTVEIKGSTNVGGLFGFYDYRINTEGTSFVNNDKFVNYCKVIGTTQIGGIVGRTQGDVKYAQNYGTIVSSGGNQGGATHTGEYNPGGTYVGGIVGHSRGAANCYNYGTINANTATLVGGIIGCSGSSVGVLLSVTLNNCFNYGHITGDSYVGGIAGYAKAKLNGSTLRNCAVIQSSNKDNEGTTKEAGSHIGGLFGYLIIDQKIESGSFETYGTYAGKDYVAGIAGQINTQGYDITAKIISAVIYDSKNYTHNNQNETVSFIGTFGSNIFGYCEGNSKVTFSENSYINGQIDANESNVLGNSTGSIIGGIAGANINLNFDIVNLALEKLYDSDYIGFSIVERSVKDSITINSTAFTNVEMVGVLFGYNNGQIKLSELNDDGSISLDKVKVINGIITIASSSNGNYVGGLVGYNDINGELSYFKASVSIGDTTNHTADYVGGVVGYNKGNIENIYDVNKAIYGQNYVGGVFGYNEYSDGLVFENTINHSGQVYGYGTTGYVGGFCGQTTTQINLSNFTQSGQVFSKGSYVGGIFGDAESVVLSNCIYNNSIITGVDCVGGIAGYLKITSVGAFDESNITIADVTATGDKVGGIIGELIIDDNIQFVYTPKITNSTSSITTITISGKSNLGAIFGYIKGGGYKENSTSISNSDSVIYINPSNISAIVVHQTSKDNAGDSIGGLFGYIESVGVVLLNDWDGTKAVISNPTSIYASNVGFLVGKIGPNATFESDKVPSFKNDKVVLDSNSNITYVNDTIYTRLISNKTSLKVVGDYVGSIAGAVSCQAGAYIETNLRSIFNNIKFSNSGAIQGTNYVGGFFGCLGYDDSYSGSMYSTFKPNILVNSANIIATGNYAGGVVGKVGNHVTLNLTNDSISTNDNWQNIYSNLKIVISKYDGSTTIKALNYCGGIAGELSFESHTLEFIINTADVGTDDSQYVGGLVGCALSGSFIGCISSPTSTNDNHYFGTNYIGGLVGLLDSGSLNDCYSIGFKYKKDNTHYTSTLKGGVVGYKGGSAVIKNSWTFYSGSKISYADNSENNYGKYVLVEDGLGLLPTMNELAKMSGLCTGAVQNKKASTASLECVKSCVSIAYDLTSLDNQHLAFYNAYGSDTLYSGINQLKYNQSGGFVYDTNNYGDLKFETKNENLFIKLSSSLDSIIIALADVEFRNIPKFVEDKNISSDKYTTTYDNKTIYYTSDSSSDNNKDNFVKSLIATSGEKNVYMVQSFYAGYDNEKYIDKFIGTIKLNVGTGITIGNFYKDVNSGDSSFPILINTLDEWNTFASDVQKGKSYEGLTVRLSNNIISNGSVTVNFAGKKDNPFSGIFDGDGFYIDFGNITFSNDGDSLFPYANGATFKNLTIKGIIDGNGKENIAAFVGQADGGELIFENCTSEVTITGALDNVAGFIGDTASATSIKLITCVNKGNITSTKYVSEDYANTDCSHYTINPGLYKQEPLQFGTGGIIGRGGSTAIVFDSCKNTGNITAGQNVGGLTGVVFNSITYYSCANTGNILAYSNGTESSEWNGESTYCTINCVGGILGKCSGEGVVYIYSSYNSGQVIAYGNVAGGLIGSIGDMQVGATGGQDKCTSTGESIVSYCYNSGQVQAGGTSEKRIYKHQGTGRTNLCGTIVGGLVGFLSWAKISYCYNTGKIISYGGAGYGGGQMQYRVGGIVAQVCPPNNQTTTITSCYNVGLVLGATNLARSAWANYTLDMSNGDDHSCFYGAGIVGYIDSPFSSNQSVTNTNCINCYSMKNCVYSKAENKWQDINKAFTLDYGLSEHTYNECRKSGTSLTLDELTACYSGQGQNGNYSDRISAVGAFTNNAYTSAQTGLVRSSAMTLINANGEYIEYDDDSDISKKFRNGELNPWIYVYGCLPQLAMFAVDTKEGLSMLSKTYGRDDSGEFVQRQAGSKESPYVIVDGIDLMGVSALVSSQYYNHFYNFEDKYIEFANGKNNISGIVSKSIVMADDSISINNYYMSSNNYDSYDNLIPGKNYHLYLKGAICNDSPLETEGIDPVGTPGTAYTAWKSKNYKYQNGSWAKNCSISEINFYPIGVYGQWRYFGGNISGLQADGNNTIIQNLKVDYVDTYSCYAGLFGRVQDAVISNITVNGSIIGTTTHKDAYNVSANAGGEVMAGAIAAYTGGTTIVSNCQAGSEKGKLTIEIRTPESTTASTYVGGIVGKASTLWCDNSISPDGSGGYTLGAEGNANYGSRYYFIAGSILSIMDCISYADIYTSIDNAGGIVGYSTGEAYNDKIGLIYGNNTRVEIIDCQVKGGTISATSNSTDISRYGTSIGGIIGGSDDYIELSISGCSVGNGSTSIIDPVVKIYGENKVGGIIGSSSKGDNIGILGSNPINVYGDVIIKRTNDWGIVQDNGEYGTTIGGIVGFAEPMAKDSNVASIYAGEINFYGYVFIPFASINNKVFAVGGFAGYVGNGTLFLEGSNFNIGGKVEINNSINDQSQIGGVAGIADSAAFDGSFTVSTTIIADNATKVGGFIGESKGTTEILAGASSGAEGSIITIATSLSAVSEIGGFVGYVGYLKDSKGQKTLSVLNIGSNAYKGNKYLGNLSIAIEKTALIHAKGDSKNNANVGGLVGLNEGQLSIVKGTINNEGTIIGEELSTIDYDNYVNLPTSFIAGRDLYELPDSYTELEYIQATGSQYIDTGFTSTKGIICEYKANWQSNGYVVGSHNTPSQHTTSGKYGRNSAYPHYDGKWEFGYGNDCIHYSSSYGASINTDYVVEFSTTSNPYMRINGVTIDISDSISSTSNHNTSDNSVKLFRGDWNNSMTEAILYYCKIYDKDGNIVRNYIPCKDASGTVGMYDTINGKFESSYTATPFVGGPEKEDKKNNVGGIIGQNNGTLSIVEPTIINNGMVSGNNNVGGIIGLLNSGNIAGDFINIGTIIGNRYVGGSIGKAEKASIITAINNNGTIASSSFNNGGSINGHYEVGGSIGALFGKIEGNELGLVNFNNSAMINHNEIVEGKETIVSTKYLGKVSTGADTDSEYIGGSVGVLAGEVSYASFSNEGTVETYAKKAVGGSIGIVGLPSIEANSYKNHSTSFAYCHFESNNDLIVNGDSKEDSKGGVGGIIGVIYKVNTFGKTNTYFINGDVKATNLIYVGGAIGLIQDSTVYIKNLLAYEIIVDGYNYVGGIVGANKNSELTIDNAYNVSARTKENAIVSTLTSGQSYGGIVGYNDNSTVDASKAYWVKGYSNSVLASLNIVDIQKIGSVNVDIISETFDVHALADVFNSNVEYYVQNISYKPATGVNSDNYFNYYVLDDIGSIGRATEFVEGKEYFEENIKYEQNIETTSSNYSNYYVKSGLTYVKATSYNSSTTYYKQFASYKPVAKSVVNDDNKANYYELKDDLTYGSIDKDVDVEKTYYELVYTYRENVPVTGNNYFDYYVNKYYLTTQLVNLVKIEDYISKTNQDKNLAKENDTDSPSWETYVTKKFKSSNPYVTHDGNWVKTVGTTTTAYNTGTAQTGYYFLFANDDNAATVTHDAKVDEDIKYWKEIANSYSISDIRPENGIRSKIAPKTLPEPTEEKPTINDTEITSVGSNGKIESGTIYCKASNNFTDSNSAGYYLYMTSSGEAGSKEIKSYKDTTDANKDGKLDNTDFFIKLVNDDGSAKNVVVFYRALTLGNALVYNGCSRVAPLSVNTTDISNADSDSNVKIGEKQTADKYLNKYFYSSESIKDKDGNPVKEAKDVGTYYSNVKIYYFDSTGLCCEAGTITNGEWYIKARQLKVEMNNVKSEHNGIGNEVDTKFTVTISNLAKNDIDKYVNLNISFTNTSTSILKETYTLLYPLGSTATTDMVGLSGGKYIQNSSVSNPLIAEPMSSTADTSCIASSVNKTVDLVTYRIVLSFTFSTVMDYEVSATAEEPDTTFWKDYSLSADTGTVQITARTLYLSNDAQGSDKNIHATAGKYSGSNFTKDIYINGWAANDIKYGNISQVLSYIQPKVTSSSTGTGIVTTTSGKNPKVTIKAKELGTYYLEFTSEYTEDGYYVSKNGLYRIPKNTKEKAIEITKNEINILWNDEELDGETFATTKIYNGEPGEVKITLKPSYTLVAGKIIKEGKEVDTTFDDIWKDLLGVYKFSISGVHNTCAEVKPYTIANNGQEATYIFTTNKYVDIYTVSVSITGEENDYCPISSKNIDALSEQTFSITPAPLTVKFYEGDTEYTSQKEYTYNTNRQGVTKVEFSGFFGKDQIIGSSTDGGTGCNYQNQSATRISISTTSTTALEHGWSTALNGTKAYDIYNNGLVGTHTIKVSLGNSSSTDCNYYIDEVSRSWVINPYEISFKDFTLSGMSDENKRVYDGTIQQFTYTISGTTNGGTKYKDDTIAVDIALKGKDGGEAIENACNVGVYTVGISGSSAITANRTDDSSINTTSCYTVSASEVSVDFEITKCPITIDNSSFTGAASYTFDNDPHGQMLNKVTVNGTVVANKTQDFKSATFVVGTDGNNETISITYSGSGEVNANRKAGNSYYSITVTNFAVSGKNAIGDTSKDNYELIFASDYSNPTYVINPASIEVGFNESITQVYKVYDGTNIAPYTDSTNGSYYKQTSGLTGSNTYSIKSHIYSDENVGTGKAVTYTFEITDKNYIFGSSDTTTLTANIGIIDYRQINITMNLSNNKATKIYDTNASYFAFENGSYSSTSKKGQGFSIGNGELVTGDKLSIVATFAESDSSRSAYNAYVNNFALVDDKYQITTGYYKCLHFNVTGEDSTNYKVAVAGYLAAKEITAADHAFNLYDSDDKDHKGSQSGIINISITRKTVQATYDNLTQSYVTNDNQFNKDWKPVTAESRTLETGVEIEVTNGWMKDKDGNPADIRSYTTFVGKENSSDLGAKLVSNDTIGETKKDNGKRLNYILRQQPTLIIGYFIENDGYEISSFSGLMLASYYYAANYLGDDYNESASAGTAVALKNTFISSFTVSGITETITCSEEDYVKNNIPAKVKEKYSKYGSSMTWDDFFYEFTLEYNKNQTNNKLQIDQTTGIYGVVYESVDINGNKLDRYGYWVNVPEQRITYKDFKQTKNIDAVLTTFDIEVLNSQFNYIDTKGVSHTWGYGADALTNFIRCSAGEVCVAINAIFPVVQYDGTTYGFNGTYDGQGYMINHLTIVSYNASMYGAQSIYKNFEYSTSKSQKGGVGMFALVDGEGSVKGINLRNASITVADTNTTFTETSSSTPITNIIPVGGIVGAANLENAIKDSSFHGSIVVNANGATPYVGGIVGYLIQAKSISETNVSGCAPVINGCISLGTINVYNNAASSQGNVGGIVGRAKESGSLMTISNVVSMTQIIYSIGGDAITATTDESKAGNYVGIIAGAIIGGNIDIQSANTNKLYYLDNAAMMVVKGSEVVMNKAVGYMFKANSVVESKIASASYTILMNGSNTAYNAQGYYKPLDNAKGTYDVMGEITATKGGENDRISSRLCDIVDIYVLMYTTSSDTVETTDPNDSKKTYSTDVVKKGSSSPLVGTRKGTSNTNDALIISNQQQVALLRQLPFATFTLTNNVTMYRTYSTNEFEGYFFGTIQDNGFTIDLVNNASDKKMFKYEISGKTIPLKEHAAA